MAAMTTRDLMRAIAAVLTTHRVALGLEGVSYPARPDVPASPWAMVRQAMALPSPVAKDRAGRYTVRPAIDVVLLVTSDVKRPQDAARLDGLAEPILDLFDATVYGGNVNGAFAGTDLPGSVNQVWREAMVRRMPLDWGEAGYCHAAIITMDAEFMRKAALP